MKLAIQLYTLRDIIRDEETLADALLHLRQMGYEGVEFAGLYDIPAPRVRQIVEQTGMHALSCHVSLDTMEQELDGVLEDARALGLDTVAMAWSAADSPEAVARAVRVLQAAQSAAEPHGVRILYHNHSHELRPVDGCAALPLEHIMQAVPLEADLYWVLYAGLDPARFLRENNSRIGLLHIKDGKKSKPLPCALGEGEADIAEICLAAADCGKEWLIVENDEPSPDGLQDARRSAEYLQKILEK